MFPASRWAVGGRGQRSLPDRRFPHFHVVSAASGAYDALALLGPQGMVAAAVDVASRDLLNHGEKRAAPPALELEAVGQDYDPNCSASCNLPRKLALRRVG